MKRTNNGEIELDMTDLFEALLGDVFMTLATNRSNDPRSHRNAGCSCKSGKCKNAPSMTPKITDFVERIISQDTATIIFWKDGTKTSVKCNADEAYDYEKGIAMATMKYVFGNRYYKDMQKLMEAYPHVNTEEVSKAAIEQKKDDLKELEDKKNPAKKSDADKAKKSDKKKSEKKSAKAKTEDAKSE